MECLDLLIACTQFCRSVLLLGKVLSKEKRKSLQLLWKLSHSQITTYDSGTCGYAGTLNDLNILDLSPFLESPVNGKLAAAESDAGLVPFYEIMKFKHCFFLWMESIQSKAGLFVLLRN